VKTSTAISIALIFLGLAGCNAGKPQSPVAVVDTERIKANWPKFQNYNNQLSVDMTAINSARMDDAQKARARGALQKKYVGIQSELVNEVRTATTQAARDGHFAMAVTREFVPYGGADITAEVEKNLKITAASPSASP